MTARTLVRLFPRAWRERYREEFVETAGDDDLRLQQVVDVLFAAADAWLSTDVRRAVRPIGTALAGGEAMSMKTLVCGGSTARYSKREAIMAAAVTLGLTVVFALAANWAEREGAVVANAILGNLAFFGPLLLSSPLWLTKGQPWRAQVVFIGSMLTVLTVIGWFAVKL
ncbi:MAG TPA: hypothetical protein VJ691_15285 [Vicinamibacterales bacterium]|nr:hypothetical protein [Vicinamibacterales bacterium]